MKIVHAKEKTIRNYPPSSKTGILRKFLKSKLKGLLLKRDSAVFFTPYMSINCYLSLKKIVL